MNKMLADSSSAFSYIYFAEVATSTQNERFLMQLDSLAERIECLQDSWEVGEEWK